VLRLAANGRSNKRIALALSISGEPVDAHMKNMLRELRARNRTHAVVLAFGRGIMTLPSGAPPLALVTGRVAWEGGDQHDGAASSPTRHLRSS
jgi:hypothetical protein